MRHSLLKLFPSPFPNLVIESRLFVVAAVAERAAGVSLPAHRPILAVLAAVSNSASSGDEL